MALVVLSACTPDGTSSSPEPGVTTPPPRGGSVVVGVHGEPPTLDPYAPIASYLTRALVRPVYPSLYDLTPDGSATPALASELTVDGTRAEVTLEPWRWSNGRRITSRDVVASVERALPPSGFARVDRVRAQGRRTVTFRSDDILDWESALATAAYVLPGGRATRVGGGPYRIAKVTPGLGLTYERNREWTGEPGLLDEVTVRYTIGLEILLGLLERGKVDVAWLPSAVNLEDRLDEHGFHHDAALGWESIELDLAGWERSPDEMRRLVSDLDRRAIERGFIRSDGRVSDTLAPGPGPGGAEGPFRGLERGPGGGNGTLQLAAPIGDELVEDAQRLLQAQLDGDGLDVELVNVEPRTLYGAWSVEHPIDAILKRRLGAPALEGESGSPADPTRIPLFHVESILAWLDGVEGPEVNPTLDGPLWNVETWFSPEAATEGGD